MEEPASKVQVWVEQLSGPARALSSVRDECGFDVVEKHLPDLESDTLDLFVFLDKMRKMREVIVLTYTSNMQLVVNNSISTAAAFRECLEELADESNWKNIDQRIGIDPEDCANCQNFLLREIGRYRNEENGFLYLPVMANSILFVWNKARLSQLLDGQRTPLHSLRSVPSNPVEEDDLSEWTWREFHSFVRELRTAKAERPLTLCGSRNGGLAFYEWVNYMGGQADDGQVLFDRKSVSREDSRHGWWPNEPNGGLKLLTGVREVLERNRPCLARYAQLLAHCTHEAFLEIDQELQLDLILNGDAVAGFVWGDQLAGLDKDGLDALGVWPVPGKRAIVSGAAALVPKSDNGSNEVDKKVKSLWDKREKLCEGGLIPSDMQKLAAYLCRDPEQSFTSWGCQDSKDEDGDRWRVYRALWESLMRRDHIVLEGGPLAHRIAAKCTEVIRRIWRRVTDRSKYESSIREVVHNETKVLEYEMQDLLETNGFQ